MKIDVVDCYCTNISSVTLIRCKAHITYGSKYISSCSITLIVILAEVSHINFVGIRKM